MNELDGREIADIIERVRRRVAAAGGERPGVGLRAEAELSAAAAAELGDGIHATIDEAVAALLRLIDEPGLAQAIGQRAREHMRRNFADEVLGPKYVQRFQQIAAKGIIR